MQLNYKSLLLLPVLALTLSCGKPYDFTNGDPRLNLRSNHRMAQVGRPYELSGMLTGRMPSSSQVVMVIVKVDGNERITGVGNLYSRMLPAPNRVFVIRFTAMDYYEAMGRLRGDGLNTRLVPMTEMEDADRSIVDEGTVTLEIEVWLVEPHPTDPTKWDKVSRYVHGRHIVKLSCPHCVY